MYIISFTKNSISGDSLFSLDSNTLKQLGVASKQDREKIKEKIKELKKFSEKEKKRMEKEKKGKSGLKSPFMR